MAIVRAKDAAKMAEAERNEKIKELRKELIKTKVGSKQVSKLQPHEIKKTIARLLTFNRVNKPGEKKK